MDGFEAYAALFQLLVVLLLLGLGFFVGRWHENRHYKAIHRREEEYLNVPALVTRTVPEDRPIAEAWLVSGTVVVSIDYFKRIAAAIRKLFGGEIRAYSSLLDRARREALLRMKDEGANAEAFHNVRIETSSISSGGRKTIGTVEVLAYATAVRYRK